MLTRDIEQGRGEGYVESGNVESFTLRNNLDATVDSLVESWQHVQEHLVHVGGEDLEVGVADEDKLGRVLQEFVDRVRGVVDGSVQPEPGERHVDGHSRHVQRVDFLVTWSGKEKT